MDDSSKVCRKRMLGAFVAACAMVGALPQVWAVDGLRLDPQLYGQPLASGVKLAAKAPAPIAPVATNSMPAIAQASATSPATPAASPPAAPPATSPPSPPSCDWQLVPDQGTLNAALVQWAEKAGWQLYWELGYDFPIELRATFCGSFENAVEKVLTSFGVTDHPVRGLFYRGNKVLRLVSGAK